MHQLSPHSEETVACLLVPDELAAINLTHHEQSCRTNGPPPSCELPYPTKGTLGVLLECATEPEAHHTEDDEGVAPCGEAVDGHDWPLALWRLLGVWRDHSGGEREWGHDIQEHKDAWRMARGLRERAPKDK